MDSQNSGRLNNEPTIKTINNIATGNTRFLIPYYQRPYAWGAVEVRQLLDDISSSMSISPAKDYYIGNIVCSPAPSDRNALENNALKVIDGQQRLTTLLLILSTLRKNIELTSQESDNPLLINDTTLRLSYLARERDNKELLDYLKDKKSRFEHSGFETARQVIIEFCQETKLNLNNFYAYLKNNVCFVLIVLSQGLDYAEYFEVINTYVKQLAKHEVLKAVILSKINDLDSMKQCAAIWDACSEMDRWIDRGFSGQEKRAFANAIASDSAKIEGVCSIFLRVPSDQAEARTLDKLLGLAEPQEIKGTDKPTMGDEPRIGSIISFSTFILMVYALETKQDNALDDNKLLETIWDEQARTFNNKELDAKLFIFRLLYWRILFDQYIIKNIRENSDNTRWLIRPLVTTEDNTATRQQDDFDPDFRMLQAFLHVSGIPKKDWLLPLMKMLTDPDTGAEGAKKELSKEELLIRKNRLFNKTLDAGLATPHYAFFVLDYELWRKYNENDEVCVESRKYRPKKDFVFRFRNSVEHVYPRNPDVAQHWDHTSLDGFGNLTLITQPSNSSYSNQMPENKRRDFAKNPEIESLKLLEIYRNDRFEIWKSDKGAEHAMEMKQVLKDSCRMEPD